MTTAVARPGTETAAATTPAPARPAPRLAPVPVVEPPFDDECVVERRLRHLQSLHRPARGQLPRQRRKPPQPPEQSGDHQEHAASALRRTAITFARALVEVVTGARGARQLRDHCAPQVFLALSNRPPMSGPGLARLQSVHLSEPATGVAEVSAVYRRGPRASAIAFRVAEHRGGWRITALEAR